jgi:hypothetical protein
MDKRIGSTVADFVAAQGDDAATPEEERLHQAQAHYDELERNGFICRTGQFRDGWPVYVTTDKNQVEDEIERLEQLERDRQ